MNRTKNSVIGRAHRLKLTPRPGLTAAMALPRRPDRRHDDFEAQFRMGKNS